MENRRALIKINFNAAIKYKVINTKFFFSTTRVSVKILIDDISPPLSQRPLSIRCKINFEKKNYFFLNNVPPLHMKICL